MARRYRGGILSSLENIASAGNSSGFWSKTQQVKAVSANSWPPLRGGQNEYTSPGVYTWIAPSGVSNVSVVCVGGGGTRGPSAVTASRSGGGGGGLAYRNNIPVVQRTRYTLVVGNSGGTGQYGNDGQTSYFINTSVIGATGGQGGAGGYGGSGGALGGTGIGTGVVAFSGGSGASGQAGSTGRGGGGGGAAGFSGAGGAGGSPVGIAGNASTGGGGGGGGGGALYQLIQSFIGYLNPFYQNYYDGSQYYERYEQVGGTGGSVALREGGESGTGGTAGTFGVSPGSGGNGSRASGTWPVVGGGQGGPGFSFNQLEGVSPFSSSSILTAPSAINGGVRILWSAAGATRSYPSSNTQNV
jgi:hypothetical protein